MIVAMGTTVGFAIQTYREHAGLTQADLADRIGVSQQSVAKWEGGKSMPRLKVLEKLVGVLGMDARVLEKTRATDMKARSFSAVEMAVPPLLDDNEFRMPERQYTLPTALEIPKEFPKWSPQSTPGGLAVAFRTMMATVVDAVKNDGKWDTVIRGATGGWRVDYMDQNLVAQFLHARDEGGLRMDLRSRIYRYLWGMTTLRKQLNDERYYFLIITLPANIDIDFDLTDKRSGDLARIFPNKLMLQRISTEAAMMGISVILARTPAQVVSILTEPSALNDPRWTDDYGDE
jgi:transcriptional regulator with XRE-family HTH domain